MPRTRVFEVRDGSSVAFAAPPGAAIVPVYVEVTAWDAIERVGEPARVTLDAAGRPSGLDGSWPVRQIVAGGRAQQARVAGAALLQFGPDRRAVLRSVGVAGSVVVRFL